MVFIIVIAVFLLGFGASQWAAGKYLDAMRKGSQEPAPESLSAANPNLPDRRVGRNDPCPCGSGKKFKNCHGAA